MDYGSINVDQNNKLLGKHTISLHGFLIILVVILLCIFIYLIALLFFKKNKNNDYISTASVYIRPTYTPKQKDLALKSTNTTLVITEKGIVNPKEIYYFHDFITFLNSTEKEVIVEFTPISAPEKILPNRSWTRSFERFGQYSYVIRGLDKEYVYKMKVVDQ